MDETISGIYQIKNKINGKCYVGQSVDIGTRWDSHLQNLTRGTHPNSHLQRAVNKYGIDSFGFSIIVKCNPEELLDKEVEIIKRKNSYNDGYNQTMGGEGTLGRKCSNITRRKISHANLGRKLSKEFRKARSEIMRGNTLRKGAVLTKKHKELLRSNNGNAKLNESDVREIKRLIQESEITIQDIAAHYNVHPSTISKIKRGDRWAHVSV